MQIKPSLRFHLALVRMAIIMKTNKKNAGENGLGDRNFIHHCLGM
jgi:hypothetical protein